MGNRIMYGNYVDGYNLDTNGLSTRLDYFTDVDSKPLGFQSITGETISTKTYTIDGTKTSQGELSIPLSSVNDKLSAGSLISFRFSNENGVNFSGIPTPKPSSSNQNITMGFSY